MDLYTKAFQKLFFPLYETVLRQRKTLLYYRQANQRQWWSKKEVQVFQWNELQQLLKHAYENCKYFRKVFQDRKITPADIKTYEDFHQLPIIDKQDIRDNIDDMVADNYRDKVIYKSTGGSTGVPLRLAHDSNSYQYRVAIALRGYSWANCEDGQNVVYIWGVPVGNISKFKKMKMSLHSTLQGKHVINSFEFTPQKMDECISVINRKKPKGIVAYTTPLYNLCLYIKKNNKSVRPVESIITAAERVYDFQREVIEDVFQGEVFNSYGCREVMLIGMECEKHEGLHLQNDNLYVEVLKEGKPAAPGETGEIVITDLHNYGMPFIRYRNGDLAVVGKESCSCGRGLPLIQNVTGRALDTIQTRDGRIIPGEFFPHLMKEFEEVDRFQVVQTSIEQIKINIVKKKEFAEDKFRILKEEITKVVGMSTEVVYEFVESIPLTSTGKYRVTISEVPVSFGN
ncbi:MAG: phenylacetate--CoA ligase family protein [Candidatus Omnitrophica bacterium]|nr:phenylacetate--CoA ligase family protein [Candidatus Omnitrophota bacterium]